MGEKLTRRDLLKKSIVAGTALAGLGMLERAEKASAAASSSQTIPVPSRSKVVCVKNAALMKGDDFSQSVAETMLGQGLSKLVGASTGAAAWKTLFGPKDVVGLKVNCLFGNGVSTHTGIAYAVIAGLKMAGVKPENIIIFDFRMGDLLKSGFLPNAVPGVQLMASDSCWVEKAVKSGSSNIRLTKIITEKITALVNIPILKHHGIPGMSGALKNHYGSLDNPSALHHGGCNPGLADLNSMPEIKAKTRLIVMDAARPQCDGGPGMMPSAQFVYNSILVARDPVAIDRIGLDILNAERKRTGRPELHLESLGWLQASTAAGLGESDPTKIDLIKVG